MSKKLIYHIIISLMLTLLLIGIGMLPVTAKADIVLIKIVINKGQKNKAQTFVNDLRDELNDIARTEITPHNKLAIVAKDRAKNFNVKYDKKSLEDRKANADIDIVRRQSNLDRWLPEIRDTSAHQV